MQTMTVMADRICVTSIWRNIFLIIPVSASFLSALFQSITDTAVKQGLFAEKRTDSGEKPRKKFRKTAFPPFSIPVMLWYIDGTYSVLLPRFSWGGGEERRRVPNNI
jgi:hypothetical protein